MHPNLFLQAGVSSEQFKRFEQTCHRQPDLQSQILCVYSKSKAILAVFATQPIISIIQRLSQQRYLVTLTQNGKPIYTDINAQNQLHVNKHWIVVSHFALQGVDYSIMIQLTETQLRQYRDKLPVIYVISGLVIAVLLLSVLHYIQAVKTQNQQLKKQKSELKELSARDSLTKVLNRRSLIDIIPKAMLRAQRSDKKMAVLFIDLDDFKTVNDNCGHRIGDLVLVEVCNRLEHRLRKHDHLGRLGGDEFVMVLEGIENSDQVATIAKRQISLFNQPIIVGHQKFLQTVSIGIAIFPDDSTDPEDLLLQADAAMYASKRMGKNNYSFFDPDLHKELSAKSEIDIALRQAIADFSSFYLRYQPQYNIQTKRMTGIEALVRWQHPTLGKVMPDNFIVIAEENRTIIPLGLWVLEHAIANWHTITKATKSTHLALSINISPVQLAEPDIVQNIKKTLKRARFSPGNLILEVTETALLENVKSCLPNVIALKKLGCKVAIDDFGKGYSSMTYLKSIPADYVKIDKDFIRHLDRKRAINLI